MGGEGKFILHASIPLVAVSGITFKHMTQEVENLIKWAKTACEEERSRIGFDNGRDDFGETWVFNLEIAIDDVEMAQGE